MYAAISAARLRHLQSVSPNEVEIALISPEPFLVIRPRLYEPKPETMKAPLTSTVRQPKSTRSFRSLRIDVTMPRAPSATTNQPTFESRWCAARA